MKRTVSALSVLAVALAIGLSAAIAADTVGVAAKPDATAKPDAKPGIKAVGLSVALAADDPSFGSLAGPLNKGTEVYLRYTNAQARLLTLDERASKVELFQDDKGTDLLKVDKDGVSPISPFPEIGPDGHWCRFSVHSFVLPAAGAKELKLKASFVFTSGSDAKTSKPVEVELKKGVKVSVEKLQAVISAVSEQKGADGPQTIVSLENQTGFELVRQVTFKDAAGKDIKSMQIGSSTSTVGDKAVYGKDYQLEGSHKKVSIVVEYLDKMEKITVPVDVTVGLGL